MQRCTAVLSLALILGACGDDDAAPVRADPEAEAVERTAPSEPREEVDEAPTEVAEPTEVPPETDVIDAPTDAPLPTKMERRLRNWLRQEHRVRTEVAAQLSRPREEGGRHVYALMQYSPFEACVAEKEASGAPRPEEACAMRREPEDWELDPQTTLRLVIAHFGPTPPRRPVGWGGAMEVVADVNLEEECSSSGRSIAVEDIDGDGADEIAVRYACSSGDSMNRGEMFITDTIEYLWVLRPDGSAQLRRLKLSETGDEYVDMTRTYVPRRFSFGDENGDGKADLIVEEVRYEGAECDTDEDGFPAMLIDESTPEEDTYGECRGVLDRFVHLYSSGGDLWDLHGPSP